MKYKILIVDDETAYLRFLGRLFRRDYQVTGVETGEEAIELLKSETFDLFILDYTLPQLTGVELCRCIRETNSKTPIIFFTGVAHLRDRQAAIKAGADEYLVKSDGSVKLLETVNKLFNHK